MASVGKYLMVLAGVALLFSMAGFELVSTQVVSDYLANFQDFKLKNFFDSIFDTILSVALVGGIIAGLITPTRAQYLILVAYSAILLAFVADIIAINTLLKTTEELWIIGIANLILIPMAILYAHAVMSWWAGRTA